MQNNLTRMVSQTGEIITILSISIRVDRREGRFYAKDENSGREYSIPELEKMADSGDPSAQCAMGDYYNSEERHADFRKAFNWYKKAANQNHAQALWNMGNFYAVDSGVVAKDFKKAGALLEESAKYGYLDAMLHLGQLCIMDGNDSKAIYWFEKADKLGHPEAKEHIKVARLLKGF